MYHTTCLLAKLFVSKMPCADVYAMQERTHESENSSTGGTALGALISFTRPNQADIAQAQSLEAADEPARKRARS